MEGPPFRAFLDRHGGLGEPPGPGKWPRVTPSGGATTASLRANRSGAFTILDRIVSTVEEITTALKSSVPTVYETPLILRFGWNSKELIDMKEISEVWRSFGDQSLVQCEIYFLDSDT